MGDTVGGSLGEFAEGVGKGAEKAFDIVVVPSESLKVQGISFGKVLLADADGNA